jgi:hypothetical protein
MKPWIPAWLRGTVQAFFRTEGGIEGKEITKPSNPASGRRLIYPKTGGWYDLSSAGAESLLGNVVGPASATDGNLALFDGTTGKLIKDGGALNIMDVVGGRLDLVDATNIKWRFLTSNQIKLYNTSWELVKVTTEPTAANTANDLAGTALAVSKVYDVFATYSSATAFTLEFSRWASSGAGDCDRIGNYSDSTGHYTPGDRVAYGSPLHDYVCLVANDHSDPKLPTNGTYWLDNGVENTGSDFCGLYQKDGVWVSGNDATHLKKRWLGVVYTYNNGGTVNFKNEKKYRYISNFYNEGAVPIGVDCPYTGTTNDDGIGTSWEKWNTKGGGGDYDNYLVSCVTKKAYLNCFAPIGAWGGHGIGLGIGLDSGTVPTTKTFFYNNNASVIYSVGSVSIETDVLGYHYLSPLQICDLGTNAFISFWGNAASQPSFVSTNGILLDRGDCL